MPYLEALAMIPLPPTIWMYADHKWISTAPEGVQVAPNLSLRVDERNACYK